MTEKVSTIEVRQRIGDLLNRVSLRHDEFIIERKGKPLAALVPVERLEQVRRFARRHALQFLEQQKGGPLSEEQAMALALEAQEWARKRARRPRRKTR
ncbi:MAG: type II toxin-antitoxin system Phd/YefM family antitoxin [Betaproteobacteria bacterium]|nr:type II toxin-antitoxin system Phd/YefM family antitoxin [Betaproteobacteria bacterium]